MGFLFKLLFYCAIVVAGGALALHSVPSLKANIIEVVNPRTKETRLLGDLEKHLQDAAALLPAARERASTADLQAGYEALQQAQEVLNEVTTLNEENAGTTRNLVSKALGALLPGGSSTPVSSPEQSTEPTASATPTPSSAGYCLCD